MDKKTFWIIVGIGIAVLLVLVVWQAVRISSISSTGDIASSAASAVQSAASSGGMVGGC